MSRLTRDGTAETVSRDQITRRERGQGNICFPCSADHEQYGNLTRWIHTLATCADYTYIYTYIQLPPHPLVNPPHPPRAAVEKTPPGVAWNTCSATSDLRRKGKSPLHRSPKCVDAVPGDQGEALSSAAPMELPGDSSDEAGGGVEQDASCVSTASKVRAGGRADGHCHGCCSPLVCTNVSFRLQHVRGPLTGFAR